MFRIHKRRLTLLEVLIAFALLVLCLFPLLYPHFFILKSQKQFEHKIELDHVVNLLYGEILMNLYKNDISWDDIANQREMEVSEDLLRRSGYDRPFFYRGTYQFSQMRKKSGASETLFLFKLMLSFIPKDLPSNVSEQEKSKQTIRYFYSVVVGTRHPSADQEANKDDVEDEAQGDSQSHDIDGNEDDGLLDRESK